VLGTTNDSKTITEKKRVRCLDESKTLVMPSKWSGGGDSLGVPSNLVDTNKC